MVSQADKVVKATLDLSSAVGRFSPTEVEDVLRDRYGDEAPSRRTVRNRLEGLAEVGVLKTWTTDPNRNLRLYSVADEYRGGLDP